MINGVTRSVTDGFATGLTKACKAILEFVVLSRH